MATEPMRGVYPILQTPFDDQDRVDEDSLRSVIDFNLDGGVHGVGIAFGSEIPKLTDAERRRVAEVTIDQVRGRVPVVVNTGAPATFAAVIHSREAEEMGADAVMSLPPPAPPEGKRAYFKAISDAVRIPIFVQEADAVVGGPLLRQIAEESERVCYAKVENDPLPQTVAEAIQHGGELVTVFGGASGSYFIEELRRGSQGTMPWASLPQAFARVWNHWEAGEEAAAVQVWEREIHSVLRIPGLVHKEILYRQGVIKFPHFRRPEGHPPLDEVTQREFDELCERLGIGKP